MDDLPISKVSTDSGELFLKELARHEKWLAAYLYTLVSQTADAEDILQECKVLMWQNFPDLKPGTNFRAWACTIAVNKVLNHRRSQQRRPYTAKDRAFDNL